MKFITTKSIDPLDFKKGTFVIYDSIESIVENTSNAKNLYILEVEEEDNPLNKFMMKTHLASKKGRFKNHYIDSTGRIIKIKRKIGLKEMNDAGATSEFFYTYGTHNSSRLESNALSIIMKLLVEKNIEAELLISFCAKIKKLSYKEISIAEDYIYEKIINIEMIIEFANKVKNYNVDKLMSYVLNYYSDEESLVLFVNSVNSCNMDSIITHLIKRDTCPNLSNSIKCIKKITSTNFDFEIVEDAVIEKDKKGKLVLRIAKEFNTIANIDKLSRALDVVDEQGFLCLKLLFEVNGVNTSFLENAIAKKDKIGVFCIELAKRPGANMDLLTERILELNNKKNGITLRFAETINELPKMQKYQEELMYFIIKSEDEVSELYKYITTVNQLGTDAIQKAVNYIKECENNEDVIGDLKRHRNLAVYL